MRSSSLASIALAAVLAALTEAPVVCTADPSVGDCLSATEASLKLRADHKLRKARAQLLVCSAPSCPGEIRDECIHRMDEVNAGLPTVVFTVKTGAGKEMSAVKVTMDGEIVADYLDGSALTLDPGDVYKRQRPCCPGADRHAGSRASALPFAVFLGCTPIVFCPQHLVPVAFGRLGHPRPMSFTLPTRKDERHRARVRPEKFLD